VTTMPSIPIWSGRCPVCRVLQDDIDDHMRRDHPEVLERLRERAERRKQLAAEEKTRRLRERRWRDEGQVWEPVSYRGCDP
jgi:hypothetical protein